MRHEGPLELKMPPKSFVLGGDRLGGKIVHQGKHWVKN